MNIRRALWRPWDHFLDGFESARDRAGDWFHDTSDAFLDRLAGLWGVAAIASLVVAIGVGVVLFRLTTSGDGNGSPPLQPAPIVRSPESLAPGAPIPGPSLATDN